MPSNEKSSVRSLTSSEVSMICAALELQAKSCERAARASSNSVVASEHMKDASMCRNLVSHFRNQTLDV